MTHSRVLAVVGLVGLLVAPAGAVMVPGGGPLPKDCFAALMTNGLGYPGGASRPVGATCADGDVCDADAARDGKCTFTPVVCLNVTDAALKNCSAAQVSAVSFKGKVGKTPLDTSGFDAAVAGLGLPTGGSPCSVAVALVVPVTGPNKKGELTRGTAKVKAKAKTTKGTDKDQYAFTCLPSVGPGATSTSTTTSVPGASTTSTTLPGGAPGAGLDTEIKAVTIAADGTVVVTFTLTDDAGVPITPVPAATTNPNQARARFTIARIDVGPTTADDSQTFTHYVNYLPNASGLPAYDSGATASNFVLTDVATGTWRYTFAKKIATPFPTDLTHTVGGQIQRTYQGEALVANPTFNFVPNGSPVTTIRQDVTTAECNACHNPLSAHGGGRREVQLCVLCHTQGSSADGHLIDFKNMIHSIHRGKDLPSVLTGPVGTEYAFGNNVFAEKVNACVGGPNESAPCQANADCGTGGTCSGVTTEGVAFPQDLRNCTKCHSQGATASNYKNLPSAAACTGCHDDVNPSEVPVGDLPPGAGHLAGSQPDKYCTLCHKNTEDGEFDITVPGAHVVPDRSTQLAGLSAEILSAAGTPDNPVTITFRLSQGTPPTPLTTLAGMNTVRLAISGPTTDFGGTTPPLLRPSIVASSIPPGQGGTLTGPDADGVFTFVTQQKLPAAATGTWRVGLEARRIVTLDRTFTPPSTEDAEEAAQNPWLDFSVDGSAVVHRREVVDIDNCSNCHGTFSKDFGVHGNLRNQIEYCVVCHNPNVTDFDRRRNAVANGADPADQPIVLKHLIHKLHRGEDLENKPYLVYGFGAAPLNYSAVDFAEVRFPGDLRDCQTCHLPGTYELPLPSPLLPTRQSFADTSVNPAVEVVTGSTPPIQDACLSCHDAADAAAHAQTNTTASGAEACNVCHEEGAIAAVSTVHAR